MLMETEDMQRLLETGTGDRQVLLETEDLILGKAKFEDWAAMQRNVWSDAGTATHMAWRVTADEEKAKERIRKTTAYQKAHDAWLIYEKESAQATLLQKHWQHPVDLFSSMQS